MPPRQSNTNPFAKQHMRVVETIWQRIDEQYKTTEVWGERGGECVAWHSALCAHGELPVGCALLAVCAACANGAGIQLFGSSTSALCAWFININFPQTRKSELTKLLSEGATSLNKQIRDAFVEKWRAAAVGAERQWQVYVERCLAQLGGRHNAGFARKFALHINLRIARNLYHMSLVLAKRASRAGQSLRQSAHSSLAKVNPGMRVAKSDALHSYPLCRITLHIIAGPETELHRSAQFYHRGVMAPVVERLAPRHQSGRVGRQLLGVVGPRRPAFPWSLSER